uniref:HCK proto-oncogene, Src family tyrosine kinase n=1 Tax=Homo sapiens TaxID=9606 RepID=H7BXG4_HUMAN
MGGRSSCEDPGCPRDEERAPRGNRCHELQSFQDVPLKMDCI